MWLAERQVRPLLAGGSENVERTDDGRGFGQDEAFVCRNVRDAEAGYCGVGTSRSREIRRPRVAFESGGAPAPLRRADVTQRLHARTPAQPMRKRLLLRHMIQDLWYK